MVNKNDKNRESIRIFVMVNVGQWVRLLSFAGSGEKAVTKIVSKKCGLSAVKRFLGSSGFANMNR